MRARASSLALLAALAVAALPACTGSSAVSSSAVSSTETSAAALPTVDQPVKFVPGEYDYSYQDVNVTFSWKDGKGILTVDNGSGSQLGPPGMYVETHQQTRVDAVVKGATPIPDGKTVALDVTFPSTLKAEDVGLFAIEFGQENWGALSPTIAHSASPSP
ncbi:MAG: hypothetical protein ACM3OO_04170 [Planctomycetaceae bacterium]